MLQILLLAAVDLSSLLFSDKLHIVPWKSSGGSTHLTAWNSLRRIENGVSGQKRIGSEVSG